MNKFNFQRSLDEVELLLKKHNDFEKSLEAQDEKIISLRETAECLARAGHYDEERLAMLAFWVATGIKREVFKWLNFLTLIVRYIGHREQKNK